MKSSELKHCADTVYLKHCAKKEKLFKKTSSLVFALIVAVSIIVIPCTTLAFNVYAVTTDSKIQVATETVEATEKKVKKHKKIKVKATEPVTEAVTEPATEPETTEATQPASEAVAVANVNSGYYPQYVSLSAYDREKLERLVTGEAASLGYEGCALVAQAIRDTMNMTGITSIDKIIADYQYTGSTEVEATDEAKKAVSHIFDNNGYAVNHRIIYFYAPNLVESKWHETQNYITTCGNMRFFDVKA